MAYTLKEKYAEMQLDPSDRRRWAAFDAFVWQHIHQHLREKPNWISQVREGTIHLSVRVKKTPTTPRHLIWDPQLNVIAYDLVHTYAERIWPDQNGLPVHLSRIAPPGRPYMRATKANMRVTRHRATNLRESGAIITEHVSTLESWIGRCVRDYLKCLVESDKPVPAKHPLKAWQLLEGFLSTGDSEPTPSQADRRHRPPPSSPHTGDIPTDELEDIEENEIVERPKRKLPDTIAPEMEYEQLPHELSGTTQQTGTQIGHSLDNHSKRKRRKMTVASHNRTSQSRSSTSTGTAQDISDGRSQSAELLFADTRGEMKSAAADDLQTGLGTLETRSDVSAYRCRIQDCNSTFHTSQELDEHVENQHSSGSQSLSGAATVLQGVSPQQCSPRPQSSAIPARTEGERAPNVQSDEPSSGGDDAVYQQTQCVIDDEEYADLYRRSLDWLRSHGKPT